MVSSDGLAVERRGPVLVARLDRPEAANALTPSVCTGLGAAVLQAESTPDVRVLLLSATGDRVFCAGMDLRAFADGRDMAPGGGPEADAFDRLLRGEVAVPVVGAATGTAVAGGFELLLGCDVIVAAEHATFGLPEVRRGLFPAGGGTRLGTRIPLSVALEMVLTGERIDAARAQQLGLVNRVVAAAQVEMAALALAEQVAANAPLGVAAAKELTRLAVSDQARADERLAEWRQVVFASSDAREGAAAFVEKRPPRFEGR